VQKLWMFGGFPVERLSAKIIFAVAPSRNVGRVTVRAFSRIASLDRRRKRRRICRVPNFLRMR
jgi:hypothetical protein